MVDSNIYAELVQQGARMVHVTRGRASWLAPGRHSLSSWNPVSPMGNPGTNQTTKMIAKDKAMVACRVIENYFKH